MAASSRVALSVLPASGLPTFARAFPFSFRPAFPSSCRIRFVPGQRGASRRERKAPAAPPRLFRVVFGAALDTIAAHNPTFSDTSFPASGTPSAGAGRAARMHDERTLTDGASSLGASPV
ncbi:hypothetical protein GOB87_14850 [Acetobacter estunensis]|uniref:Uncharacterized protein n=1 Tax=Acetobacter estunensis TaxID=104097 RepID=A0A967BET8_9PROT|nr:hypothetical protein [Acetobacter estunensis]NHO55202.1 hypothetical protein [Acetobacter estunensis]